MLEVEKKFRLNAEQEELLLAGATKVNQKTFVDIYYDTKKFKLTGKDWWLRSRDDKFELKIPHHSGPEREADQYTEITDEKEILAKLKLEPPKGSRKSIKRILEEAKLEAVCELTTTRRKYRKNDFTIDLDQVKADKNFHYTIAEIELMVPSENEVEPAIQSILSFAGDHSLQSGYVRGKVLQYLKEHRPEHFQALLDKEIIKRI